MWQHRHWPFNSRFQCCHILAHSSNAALPRCTALPEIPQINETKKKNQMCFFSGSFINFGVPSTFSGGKKGEKGQSNKKGQQMEGGGEPELSHVTSVDRLTGTPPRAHTQKGEKTFDDSILLCRLSSFLLKKHKKNVLRPFQLFLFKRNQIFTFFKKRNQIDGRDL